MVMGLSKEVERQLAAYPAAAVEKWFGLYSQLGELRVRYQPKRGRHRPHLFSSVKPARLLRRREGLDRGRNRPYIPSRELRTEGRRESPKRTRAEIGRITDRRKCHEAGSGSRRGPDGDGECDQGRG